MPTVGIHWGYTALRMAINALEVGYMRGPVPERSNQRRRRNKSEIPIDSAPAAEHVDVPTADDDWHPIAKRWFESLTQSGQSYFYEPSDWATAVYIAEAMSINLNQGKFSAVLFANVLNGMSSLLATEGDRRRLRVELAKAQEADLDEVAATAEIDKLLSDITGKQTSNPSKRLA